MTAEPDVERLLAHADWLRALARRLVGSASADDVVQETFITALRSPPDADRPPRPWLGSVLRNVARMRHRTDSRRAQREDVAALAPVAATAPDDAVQRLETHRMLTDLVLGLEEPYRRTLVLHYFDGLALADIARTDGVPEATVRWRHRHAIDRLRARLDERAGGDRRAWVASLAPIAAPRSAATLVLGGLLVKKLVAGVILAIAAALIVWKVTAREPAAPPIEPARPTAQLSFGQPKVRIAGERRSSIHGVVRGAATASVSLFEIADAPIFVAQQDGVRFDFGGLGAGTYCAVASAGALAGSSCEIAIGAGDRVERDITLARRDARLHGTVNDADGGAIGNPLVVVQSVPVAGAVSAARGDANGHYELALAPGWYRVTVQADGYTTAWHHVEIVGERRFDVRLNAGATIAGRVVDDQQRPAAGATVSIAESSHVTRSTKSGPDGRFKFEGLRPGRFEVIASTEDLVAAPQPVVLAFAATREVELVLGETRAALEGRVVDESDAPVAGTTIDVTGPVARTAKTDREGKFRVGGLLGGHYDLAATADGFVRGSAAKLVGQDGKVEVTIRLSRGVMVTGVVRTASGQFVADATVGSSASNLRDPRLDVKTDDRGGFRIGPLPSGSVRLSAFHAMHGVSEIVDVELPPGSAPSAELVFKSSASIEGVVRLDDGTPASGAVVTVTPTEAPANWSIAADHQGRFALGSLPAGEYRVAAAPPIAAAPQTLLESKSSATVTLAAGVPKQVELTVPGGSEHVRGRVVDEHGAPVAGAAVWAEREARMVMSGASLDQVRTYSWTDGTFDLAELPRGTFTVYASHPDRATGSLAAVTAGSSGVTIALVAPASVSGRAMTRDGTPIRSFSVVWQSITRSGQGGEVMTRTSRMFHSPDGRFELDHLDPTRMFILTVESAGGATGEPEKFSLAAGERKTGVEIRVSALGKVRGRVVDRATTRPAIGLVVFFPVATRGMHPVDGNGRFEAELPEGAYKHLNVQSASQGYPSITRAFTIKPGELTDLGDVMVDLR